MTSGHFVANGNFTLLGHINADQFIDTRRKFITIDPGKDPNIYDLAVFPVGHSQRGIPHFSGLLAKDGAKKPLFRHEFRFSFGGNFSHQNIAGTDFGTDADNAGCIEIFQNIIADIGDISGDFFRSQFGISSVAFVFFNMNRGEIIISD